LALAERSERKTQSSATEASTTTLTAGALVDQLARGHVRERVSVLERLEGAQQFRRLAHRRLADRDEAGDRDSAAGDRGSTRALRGHLLEELGEVRLGAEGAGWCREVRRAGEDEGGA
jgi:hypothetical protein